MNVVFTCLCAYTNDNVLGYMLSKTCKEANKISSIVNINKVLYDILTNSHAYQSILNEISIYNIFSLTWLRSVKSTATNYNVIRWCEDEIIFKQISDDSLYNNESSMSCESDEISYEYGTMIAVM